MRTLSDDFETISQLQMYWDLTKISFTPDKLLQEIIKADIGDYNFFALSVYFAYTHNTTLFHLYDDRGADVVGADKKFLRPIYEKLEDRLSQLKDSRINPTDCTSIVWNTGASMLECSYIC